MKEEVKEPDVVTTVLSGHNETNPYLVKDYPFGFTLRCQQLVWIERLTRGHEYRVCRQTTNPKSQKTYRYYAGEALFEYARSQGQPVLQPDQNRAAYVCWHKLNKPKKSTGNQLFAMYLNQKGYVCVSGLWSGTLPTEIYEWSQTFKAAYWNDANAIATLMAMLAQKTIHYSVERVTGIGDRQHVYPAQVTPEQKVIYLAYAEELIARFKKLTDPVEPVAPDYGPLFAQVAA